MMENKCGYCDSDKGFHKSVESFCSDEEPKLVGVDQFGFEIFEDPPDVEHEVQVCNNCGEFR